MLKDEIIKKKSITQKDFKNSNQKNEGENKNKNKLEGKKKVLIGGLN